MKQSPNFILIGQLNVSSKNILPCRPKKQIKPQIQFSTPRKSAKQINKDGKSTEIFTYPHPIHIERRMCARQDLIDVDKGHSRSLHLVP